MVKWTYEACYEEAKKYKTRTELARKSPGCYEKVKANGWINDYNWLVETNYGYWNDYNNCYQEALKFYSRSELENCSSGCYESARKHGWLKDYTWFKTKTEVFKNSKTIWDEDSVREISKKFHSRTEFSKGASGAYSVALKNGWIKDYTWLQKPKPKRKWSYDEVLKEAHLYLTLKEFRENSSSAYSVAKKNKWIEDFDFLSRDRIKRNTWQEYENVYNEAKKYTTLKDFSKNSAGAYQISLEKGWIANFDWLEREWKQKWDYESCYNEALKCKSRSDFKQKNPCAYTSARVNKWLDDYHWLKDERFDLINDKIDCVYAYEFIEQKTVYVGRTLMKRIKIRDKEHLYQLDTVSNFAKDNNIPVPEMKILEDNLTIKEGSENEGIWLELYKEDGWKILNIAKTGSIGTLAKIRWTKEKCFELAKNCISRSDFKKHSYTAYNNARKHDWLDEFFPKSK